ncbi:hypothetical protein KY347_01765 [Candidatus Woesearchaeota archaeon]|nr:hypothetical protein [Candidatus Woesearchaeota archaeon]
MHPFYLHLSEMSHLTNLTIGDADDYLNRAMDVLEGGIPKENASIVVLDTIHHYAATTSLLLEEKTIDQVRFTEYDQGYLVDSSELNQIKGKNLFFAGAYNKKCLSQSIVEILNKKHPMEKLWIIRDLVLDSPGQRIRTLKVIGRTDTGQYDIPRKNAITLEEAIRKIEDCA